MISLRLSLFDEHKVWTACATMPEMNTVLTVLIWGLSVILAGFLGYFRSYMKKKGENVATHEDIEKLVDQVKAVTEATKKIEAEISAGVWDKQKRWEMKREVLFEAAKRLSEIDDAMLSLTVAMKEDRNKQKAWENQRPSDAEQLGWGEAKNERLMRWSKAATDFDESRVFVTIVCTKDSVRAFNEFGAFMHKLGAAITEEPETYDKSRGELFKKLLKRRWRYGKNWRLMVRSQSNESWTAPIPARQARAPCPRRVPHSCVSGVSPGCCVT
jgi:hypothetical protein